MPFVHGTDSLEVTVAITQTTTALTASITVPAGTTAEVCLPAPHGAPATGNAASSTLTVDGQAVVSVAKGRMLCATKDVAPGAHVLVRLA